MSTDTTAPGAPIALRILQDGTLAASRREVQAGLRYRLQIQPAAETAPAMLMALETGTVDFICTDMPTAMGAVAAYPDMKILDFTDSDDNFAADEGDINIGVSVMKGNTVLKDAIDSVLSTMTVDDFNAMMDEAIAIQPLSEG